MRYIIYGAGAIGGVIGARLHQAGKTVRLIARGLHLQALQQNGLRFVTPEGTETLRIPAVGRPSEIAFEKEDVVLLTVKSQDTGSALASLREAAGDRIPVICAQNGVANEWMALRLFSRVYAMVVMLPASHLEPGVVVQNSTPIPGILDAGRYPSGKDQTIETVCRDLESAGFSSRVVPSIMRFKYTKLLLNLGNAFQVVCGPEADGREILRLARKEALTCYQAAKIDFADDQEFRARRGDLIRITPTAGQQRLGSSSWQSVIRGSGSSEADWLNGEICLLGRLWGVPTPVNHMLQDLANQVASGKIPPGSITPEALQQRLAQAP